MTAFSEASYPRPDHLSLATLLALPMVGEQQLSVATGFVVEREGKNYFVTNWHVLAGRDSETGRVLSSTLAVPDRLRLYVHSELSRVGWGAWHLLHLDLFDEQGNAVWLQHPKRMRKDMEDPGVPDIDVGVMPLPELRGVLLYAVDLALGRADLHVPAGHVVHAVGYPFGLTGGALLPLWKTGHMASGIESDVVLNGYRLIDITGREGMSGAPVIARSHGVFQHADGSVDVGLESRSRLIGVYSGRLRGQRESRSEAPMPLSSEIGIVWTPDVIAETISSGVPGPARE